MCVYCARIHTGLIEQLIRWWIIMKSTLFVRVVIFLIYPTAWSTRIGKRARYLPKSYKK